MTVFSVWYSMPAVLGSFRLRIAEWTPAERRIDRDLELDRLSVRQRDRRRPDENVPSLPFQLRLYVFVPPPPELRVNVYVRLKVSPTCAPSRT